MVPPYPPLQTCDGVDAAGVMVYVVTPAQGRRRPHPARIPISATRPRSGRPWSMGDDHAEAATALPVVPSRDLELLVGPGAIQIGRAHV